MVEINFDVVAEEPTGYGPLPAGEYDGEIVAADVRQTKAGTDMLSLEIQTAKGKVWDNLNLWHSNPKAVEIAKERLSAIGRALNMARITDTDQLLAKRVKVRVGIQERNPNYNEVLGYASASSVAPSPEPQTTATQASSPPWA